MSFGIGSHIKAAVVATGLGLAVVATGGAAWAVDAEKSASHLEEAREHFDEGRIQAAVIELRNALKADAGNVDARLLLAEIYLAGGQGIGAQTEIEAARQRGADQASTAVMMAKALFLQAKPDDALAELDAVEVPEADRVEGLLIRADVAAARNDAELAEQLLREAEAADPAYYRPKLGLARLLMNQRRLDEARQLIDAAIALEPASSVLYAAKGLILRNDGDTEGAITALSTAVEFNEDNVNARLDRAAIYADTGRLDEAQADVDHAYRLIPDHPMAHYISAVIFARRGEYEAADERLIAAGPVIDRFLPAAFLKGLVSYQLRNYEQAALHLSRVVDDSPNMPSARLAYGATLLRMNDARGAIGVLEPLVEAGTDRYQVYAMLASAHMRAGNFDESTEFFERAAELAPDSDAFLTQIAVGKFAVGDQEAAVANLELAIDESPDQLRAAVMLALIERRRGNPDAALEAAQKVIDISPDQAIGYNLKGVVQVNRQELDDARSLFNQALELRPDYHSARTNLAELERLVGDNEAAERHLRYVLSEDRNNVSAMVAAARLALLQNEPREAVDLMQRAVEVRSNAPQMRVLLGQSYLASGDQEAAVQTFRDADRDFPDNALVILQLASLYMTLDDFDRAVSEYGRLVRLSPDDLAIRRQYGLAQLRAGQVESARLSYLRALELASDRTGADVSTILRDLARLEASQGNFDDAVAYARDVKKSYPDQNLSEMLIGDLLMAAGRVEEATASFLEAKDVEDGAEVRVRLYQAYRAQSQPDEAIAVLSEWLQTEPDTPQVRALLADAHLAVGRYSDAVEQYEAIRSQTGDNVLLLNNLAWSYYQLGDGRALETAEKAYELAPDTPQVADTLGWILVDTQSDVKRGLLLIENAHNALPEDRDVAYHLAVALNANGRTDAAREQLRQLVDGDDNFASYQKARDLLRDLSQ